MPGLVEKDVIVITVVHIIEKVIDRDRSVCCEEINADIALIRMQNDSGRGHQVGRQQHPLFESLAAEWRRKGTEGTFPGRFCG